MHRFPFLATFLVAALLFLNCSTGLFAETYGDLTYELSGGRLNYVVTITNCNTSASGEINIPAEIEGWPVTAIGDNAFDYCSSLTSVTIPDSVTSIGDYAFYRCSSLTSIDVDPDNLYFSSLDGILFNKLQTTLIQYTGGVIGSYAIPNTVTTIGDLAFAHSLQLTSVTISSSVDLIENAAFFGCYSLTSVTFDGDAPSTTGDYRQLFPYAATDFVIYYYGGAIGFYEHSWLNYPARILFYYEVNEGSITITDSGSDYIEKLSIPATIDGKPVTSIGDYAFEDCDDLIDVTIPDSVTSIGDHAFEGCDYLIEVTIPDSVTSIGDHLFNECYSLENVTIGNGVTSIGNYTFEDCPNLTDVTIGNSVTSIGDHTFDYCYNLTSVTIPDSVTTIGYAAFYLCYSLENIAIGNGVTSIGDYAFYYCDSLTSVTIPDSVTSIGDYAFYCCDSLTSVTIPDSVTSIGNAAFCYCNSLTSVTIPGSVTSIGNAPFSGCSSLTSIDVDPTSLYFSSIDGILFNKSQTTLIQYLGTISGSYTIPGSVTAIGNSAFSNCGGLTNLSISDSVTSIGGFAFSNCVSLTSIDVDPNNLYFSSIGGILFNKSQTTLIQYPGTISGSYTIPDSVTTIGDSAFSICRSNLTNIHIPNSVTSIGKIAFYGCDSLTSVIIPDSVTTIGDAAFYKCDGLTSVTIGNSVTTIGDLAFQFCSKLTSVTIGNSVTTIGDQAFYDCDGLTSITIPDSVTTIGPKAFNNCYRLTSLTFNGDAPDSFEYSAFDFTDFTIYFYEDAANFTAPTWLGYPSEALSLTGDNDGDNWPNNLERLLGTSPVDGNSCFKTWLSQGETGLQIHHAPYSEACEFVVESTTDLSDPESWQAVEGLSFSGDTTEQMAELSTADEPAVFYRVSVSEIE